MSHPKESIILGRLLQRQDPTYRDFHKKLLPTVDPERLIGVRTPQLRSLAKELSGTPEAEDFLASLPHTYYDENTLHGLLISNGKDISWVIAQLDRFLPFVDNWATCDLTRPKIFQKHLPELLPKVKEWLADPQYSDGTNLTNIPYGETDNYVKKVTKAYEKHKELYELG